MFGLLIYCLAVAQLIDKVLHSMCQSDQFSELGHKIYDLGMHCNGSENTSATRPEI